MRVRRVGEHGSAPLRAAVEAGLISVYRAGEIARLPVGEQEIAVACWAARGRLAREGPRIATEVIRAALSSRDAAVDLEALFAAIRVAIAGENSIY